MIAVDTNVVVRFLTRDHEVEAARALALFERETVLLPKTVLLETEWVLRSSYSFPPARCAAALRALIAMPNVKCEDLPAVTDALRWMQLGVDFADALHLASAKSAERFATFDRRFAARAQKISDVLVVRA